MGTFAAAAFCCLVHCCIHCCLDSSASTDKWCAHSFCCSFARSACTDCLSDLCSAGTLAVSNPGCASHRTPPIKQSPQAQLREFNGKSQAVSAAHGRSNRQ